MPISWCDFRCKWGALAIGENVVFTRFYILSVGLGSVYSTQNCSHRGKIYHRRRPVDLFFANTASTPYEAFPILQHRYSPLIFARTQNSFSIATNKVTLHELNLVLLLRQNQLVNRNWRLYFVEALRTEILFVQAGKCPKIWAFRKQRGWSKGFRLVVLVKNSKNPPSS